MRKPEARSPYREEPALPQSLSDRVRSRVTAAEAFLADTPVQGDDTLHTLALWQVFEEFGDTRRAHRRKTGDGVIPELAAAARAFRRRPSTEALVAIASHLDARGLLRQ
jgi:hypothetical protein